LKKFGLNNSEHFWNIMEGNWSTAKHLGSYNPRKIKTWFWKKNKNNCYKADSD